MKIAVISSTVFPCPPVGYSGLEQLAWLIAKGLAAKGHEVSLIAPDGSSCPNATIIPTGPPGNWNEFGAYEKYWQELPKHDVIIDHSWTKCAYLLKAENTLKAPVLGVLHAPVDTMYAEPPPLVEKPCFVCISNDQREHLENHLHRFHSKAKTAYNGIDLDFYKQVWDKRSDRFLFLARFSQIKGPDIAIRACKEAGVGLDLIGDTQITNEPDYLAQCLKMCDGKQIKLHGNATRGECVWWFSCAKCLLHPNKNFREPFGLAPVEAMACGCPVICWNYGAVRETIEHESTGWLVESEKEMVEVIKEINEFSDEKWQQIRRACREQASQFSVPKMIDRYEALCEEAIHTGGW